MSDSEEYEYYAYSSDEDDGGYAINEGDDGTAKGKSGGASSSAAVAAPGSSMDWEPTSAAASDNPNAAPTSNGNYSSHSPSGGTSSSPYAATKSGIRMMDASELRPEMERRVQDVMDMLGVDVAAASVLLREHNWSKERLIDDFMNDSEKLLHEAGVYHRCGHVVAPFGQAEQQQQPAKPAPAAAAAAPSPVAKSTSRMTTRSKRSKASSSASAAAAKKPAAAAAAPSTASSSSSSSNVVTCLICYEDYEDYRRDMMAMPCGHAFCMGCWRDFCINAIEEDGPACVGKTCPHAGCPEVVTEEEMARALDGDRKDDGDGGDNGVSSSLGSKKKGEAKSKLKQQSPLAKYHSFQLRSYVESNRLTRWCPGAGCERVACAISPAVLEAGEGRVAKCDTCMTKFCLPCGEEPHAPASCKDMAMWNEKCRNESETANWILANTKSCPKCVSRIEKNQGCNHMTCQRCRFEFCWICMGDWKDHGSNTGGYYKCSRYQGGEGADTDQSDSARAKRDLDRYLHYYRRFHAHQEAEKFAKHQLKETESKMVQLQESSDDAKWTDVEFLKTANEQLVECRRVLKYTYVFGYYLDPRQTNQRERFEHHQEMLERFTEYLSELSEKSLPEMDRTDVVNKTRVVDQYMKNILKYIEDGMEEVM